MRLVYFFESNRLHVGLELWNGLVVGVPDVTVGIEHAIRHKRRQLAFEEFSVFISSIANVVCGHGLNPEVNCSTSCFCSNAFEGSGREEPSKDNPESNLLDDNRPVVEIKLVAGLALEKDIAEADLRR